MLQIQQCVVWLNLEDFVRVPIGETTDRKQSTMNFLDNYQYVRIRSYMLKVHCPKYFPEANFNLTNIISSEMVTYHIHAI